MLHAHEFLERRAVFRELLRERAQRLVEDVRLVLQAVERVVDAGLLRRGEERHLIRVRLPLAAEVIGDVRAVPTGTIPPHEVENLAHNIHYRLTFCVFHRFLFAPPARPYERHAK